MSEQLNVSALIIDDSKQARKLLRMMFKDLAPCIYIVGEAENVLEGLNLIEQFKIALSTTSVTSNILLY